MTTCLHFFKNFNIVLEFVLKIRANLNKKTQTILNFCCFNN